MICLKYVFLREAPITFLWPTRSQRPSVRPRRRAVSVRPDQQMSLKSTAWNGFKSWNTRQRGSNFGPFLGSHQIRQLTQSDPIILILYVDDKKKPKWITQRFAPPALRVLSSNSTRFKKCWFWTKSLFSGAKRHQNFLRASRGRSNLWFSLNSDGGFLIFFKKNLWIRTGGF